MAELKRKEDQLTTADLVGRGDRTRDVRDVESRPQLVRDPLRNAGDAPLANELGDDRIGEHPLAYRGPVTQLNNTGALGPENSGAMATDNKVNEYPSTPATDVGQSTPLFAETEVGDFRTRWSTIQTGFVDEPRRAVEGADNLVASLMKKLAEGFANERERLEKQWDRGDNVSTEDLRIALQRYRSFFDRLLKV
jgi:hypothetical protein